MIGTWVWNALAAAVVAGLIFFLAYPNNPLETVLYRVGVSFAVTFAVTYAVRWMLGQALSHAASEADAEEPSASEPAKGQVVDWVTPDSDLPSIDDEVQERNPGPEKAEQAEFSPLNPPKLVTDTHKADPKQTAEVIRKMIDE